MFFREFQTKNGVKYGKIAQKYKKVYVKYNFYAKKFGDMKKIRYLCTQKMKLKPTARVRGTKNKTI